MSIAPGRERPYQLSKLEAIEGNWKNGDTGFVLFGVPDQQAARNIAELDIPCPGSCIAKGLTLTDAEPTGLNAGIAPMV